MSDLIYKNGGDQEGGGKYQYIPEGNSNEGQSDSLDPKRIIALLLKYKWIILALLLVGGTGAFLYSNVVTPSYQSVGSLLISSAEQTTTDELSNIISQATGHGTSSTLENELQVLQSRKFSLKVADNLLEKRSQEGENYPILWQINENGDRTKASRTKIADRIKNGISLRRPEEKSDVIGISFISNSPKEAAYVVNSVMGTYIEASKHQSRRVVQSTSEFLEGKRERLQKKLQDSEQKLKEYMDATGLVNVDQQSTDMAAQESDVEDELRNISLELKSIKENISNYKKQLGRMKEGLSEHFSEAVGPRIRNAQETLAKLEQERSLLVAKNPGIADRENPPARLKYLNKQITRLEGEINKMSQKLFTSDDEFTGMNSEDRAQLVSKIQGRLVDLQMRKGQLKTRRQTLSTHKKEMDAKFNSLPEGMVKLAKLQRKVKINEELYLNVLRQYSDMSVLRESKFGLGRIIDPGYVPHEPVSPNKKLFVFLGIMLGGVLAAGFIVVTELRDDTVNDVGQLRTIYLPPTTVIPSFNGISDGDKENLKNGEEERSEGLILLNDRSNIASEAIKRLKNNIIYQNGESPPNTIAITSAEKGDGKSTIASNLGIAFAESGYWTLIIGTDFRRPKLHKLFDINPQYGLAGYLKGDIDFDQLISDTKVDSMKVIGAGQSKGIPSGIDNDLRFQELLEKMKKVFDVVILDTPPYGIVSDSTPLLKRAETTVVVARHRKTNKAMLYRTMEELEQINANTIGIVLNDFDHELDTSNYYGSGYYQSLYSNYENYL